MIEYLWLTLLLPIAAFGSSPSSPPPAPPPPQKSDTDVQAAAAAARAAARRRRGRTSTILAGEQGTELQTMETTGRARIGD